MSLLRVIIECILKMFSLRKGDITWSNQQKFRNPGKKASLERFVPKSSEKSNSRTQKVPELVGCRSFRKWPIWSVPEWGCCWWFWNSQKQSVPESQKNNVLGMFLVLKTAFFAIPESRKNRDSRTPKKQCFRNACCSDMGAILRFWNG